MSEWELWIDEVERVAKFVAGSYPDVEADDLTQDLWEFVISQTKFDSPESDGASTALYWLARRKAGDYRAQHLTLSPQYSYRTDDLRDILPSVFSAYDWLGGALTSDPADDTLCERVAIYSDVTWGLQQLTPSYKKAIFERYVEGTIHEAQSAGRRTLNRALGKLADVLNTYSRGGCASGPTVRKPLSISQSKHLINEPYGNVE